jgi:YihY family inner membrane protein
MSTATRVPQTRTMEDLEADDAWATLRRHGVGALATESFTRFRYGDGFSHARALGLQFCLSFVPLVIALVGLSATLHADRAGRVLSQTLRRLVPGGGGDAVEQAISTGSRSGQLALWLGLAVAVVSLTTAMAQVERGANRIYGIQRDRPSTQKYGRAAVMAVTAGVTSMLGFLVLVAGGAIGESLTAVYGWGDGMRTAWTVLRWPLGIVLAVVSYTVVFRRAPRRHQPGFSWLGVGAAVSLALWLLFTLLLALYVSASGSFGSTYGPLTGFMALLVWAYLTSLALLFGIAVAAQLEALHAGVREPASPDPEPMEQSTGRSGHLGATRARSA